MEGKIEVTKDSLKNVRIDRKELKRIFKWVDLNRDILMDMWFLIKNKKETVELENGEVLNLTGLQAKLEKIQ